MAINSRLFNNRCLRHSEYESLKSVAQEAQRNLLSLRDDLVRAQAESDQELAAVSEAIRDQAVKTANAVVEWGDEYIRARIEATSDLCDADTHEFIDFCQNIVATLLVIAEKCFSRDVSDDALLLIRQAQKVIDISRKLHNAWPWADADGVDESWRQYHSGELMGFESFKNAVQRTEK